MELSINSTRLSSKMGKNRDFLTCSFLCILLVLLFFWLILGGRGSYVAAIQRRILFTTALYFLYWWTLHPEPPVLPLSLVLCFLSLHISLIYRDLTVIPGWADRTVWAKWGQWLKCKTVKGSHQCWFICFDCSSGNQWKQPSQALRNQLCWLDAHYFKLWTVQKTQFYLQKEAPLIECNSTIQFLSPSLYFLSLFLCLFLIIYSFSFLTFSLFLLSL